MNKWLLHLAHRSTTLIVTTFVLVVVLHCSTNTVSGTSGSETGNGKVSGCIVDTAGRGHSGVQVMLLPNSYDPQKSSDSVQLDTTDASGNYLFACPPGNYTIQSTNHSEGTKTYSDSVLVDTSDIVLAPDTLKVPGTITIALPGNGHLQNGYFYIPGTTIYSFSNDTRDTVTLDAVPAASITSVCYAETGNNDIRIIRNNIQVTAGDFSYIDNPEWEYARPVYINTSSTGVQITKKVADFPILIRLSKHNFTFEQSSDNGSDLFFTNADDIPLPFEIEHWDPAAEVAEVWVKVDTIRTDSDSQNIMMFWGNPSPDHESSAALVFDTANGYQGVWHLNEDPVSGADSIADGTINSSNGTWKGSDLRTVGGAIGQALAFGSSTADNESCIELPNKTSLDYHGAITVSCWIRLSENSPDSFNFVGKYSFCEEQVGECIISGYALFCSSQRTIQLRIGFGSSLFFFVESDARITDTSWHYIAAMFQPKRITLCIDDSRKEYDLPETPIPSPEAGFIGGKSFLDGTEPFAGNIDEVRISNTIRSADWIRLNYMNQKQIGALVVWE